ncbi:MAG TPA: sigma-70 family RNA polymerase sigma factor [Acidimicrobiales bacterium]|nr:sigma-70 family RNA polymerase sigma factor [Acidimicrobiales bacterium]
MDERDWLTARFEQHRSDLRRVAYRMLGSLSEADDALQEAWLRVRDQDPASVQNMQAWLSTVVGRVCLNMLRSRRRHGASWELHVPDPVVVLNGSPGPDQEALIADSVGLALQVVLDSLNPAERLAFVLHDVFGVHFAEIASVLGRPEAAAQQLASRARRRVRGIPEPDADLGRQKAVVGAFFAASRDGDFKALLELLDPEVELRIDGGALRKESSLVLRGAAAVATHTATYSKWYPLARPALVNGAAGAVVSTARSILAVMGFTVRNGKVAQIDVLMDPDRLGRLRSSWPAYPEKDPI